MIVVHDPDDAELMKSLGRGAQDEGHFTSLWKQIDVLYSNYLSNCRLKAAVRLNWRTQCTTFSCCLAPLLLLRLAPWRGLLSPTISMIHQLVEAKASMWMALRLAAQRGMQAPPVVSSESRSKHN